MDIKNEQIAKLRGWIPMGCAVGITVFLRIGEFAFSADTPKAETEDWEILIGTKAPEWTVDSWLHSKPVQLKDLKGKVVLVRFWTAPHCPFCRASVPALNEFYKKYHQEGLEVIGFYHQKSREEPLRTGDVQRYAEDFNFRFPIAIDYDWKTLRKWWLDRVKTDWTSVSFLMDKNGVIRYIHPGGQYVKGDQAYLQIKRAIEESLK